MKIKDKLKNKKNKRLLTVIISFLLVLIILPSVSALGITPAVKVIDFKPGLEETVDLRVINSGHKDMKVVIYADGELSDLITFTHKELKFLAADSEKSFTYTIKLPVEMREPGEHKANIIVREVPLESEGELVITTILAVVSQLYVRVPYPGKYVKADLYVQEAEINETVTFVMPVYNFGKENIENTKATIFILTPEDKEKARVESDTKSIDVGKRKELIAKWKADTIAGVYKVIAVVDYDGQKTKIEKSLLIGGFFIKVLDISVSNFKLGQVAKFNILLENIANKNIEQVEARMLLNDELEKLIADIKSDPVDILALTKKEAIAYWDTEGVLEGDYHGKIILSYEDRSAERKIRSKVSTDAIKTEIFDITGRVIGGAIEETRIGGKEGLTKKNLVIMFLILAIIAAIAINRIIYSKKKKRRTRRRQKSKKQNI